VRASDTVSRQADDKFIVLLSAVAQSEDVAVAARRLKRTLAKPYSIGDHDVSLNANIGISVSPEDGLDAEMLIEKADIAMYRARAYGRESHQLS